MIVPGFHGISTLLERDAKVLGVYCFLNAKPSPRVGELRRLAREKKVAWREYSESDRTAFEREFTRLGGDKADLPSAQGIFAVVPEFQYAELLPVIRAAKEREPCPILLALDSVTDPQNVGSILRSAAFFGVSGLIIPEHRSAPMNAAAVKISSGGFLHVPVVRAGNLNQALEVAKEEGFWIVGMSEHGRDTVGTARLDAPLVLVIGNEESGIRSGIEKACDWMISLPTYGALTSLNAAVAAAVSLALVRHRQDQLVDDDQESEE